MSKKKKDWKIEKERLGRLELEERRKEYRRSDYVTLDKIHTWRQANNENGEDEGKEARSGGKLSDKVSLYKGDITILELDAIVNAANSSLLGGGGVDGCIHKAAGSCLYDECNTLNGCETGYAKITCGYDLPAKHVIHTVGPVARGHVGSTETRDLTSCYQNSLKLLMEQELSTVAFPCISTGIYGFPNEPAADIALKTVKAMLEEHPDKITRVIFCVFLETDYKIYKEKMSKFFEDNDKEEAEEGQEKEDNTTSSNKPKSKSEGSNEEEGETADEDMASQQDPADPEDVTMDSQKPDGDSNPEEADGRDEKKGIAVEMSSPAGETKPASDDRGEEDEGTGRAEEDTAEAAPEQRPSDTENDSSQDVGAQKDTEASQDPMDLGGGSEKRESETSPSEVDMKAQGEDSQESDLPSTDSTHSKEPAAKKE